MTDTTKPETGEKAQKSGAEKAVDVIVSGIKAASSIESLLRTQTTPGDVNNVANAWEQLWAGLLSKLVEEAPLAEAEAARSKQDPGGTETSSGQDSPGVDWNELGQKKYQYRTWVQELFRKVRRLFARFSIETFVEARSFAEYRLLVEEEWRQVKEETDETIRACDSALQFLAHISEALTATPGMGKTRDDAIDQLSEIAAAVRETQTSTRELRRLLDDGRFRKNFFETLRQAHKEIQANWGTWVRRVKTPSLLALCSIVVC